MTQRWAEMAVEVAGDAQEIVGALMTEVAGCYGYSSTATHVNGYLPVDDRLENTLLRLREALKDAPGVRPELTIRFVAEEDWANAWKQFFKPQRIGERFVVKPTWEEWTPAPNDVVIQIDPGMAFGTGLHATTRLCLRALEEQVRPGMTVADVGTGSGILAVGAALLGAGRVDAVDNDPVAVRVAQENVDVNAVGDRVTVAEASAPPAGAFDIVVANILADVILGMASALFAATVPSGLLITSGIIEHRAEDVRRGLSAMGFTIEQTATDGEWVAVLARRRSS
jgi:ribosomal protein L11 methyltransferase